MQTTTVLALTAAAAVLVGSAGAATASSAERTDVRLPAAYVQELTGPEAGLLGSEAVGQSTLRLSGADRYETSVEISRVSWTPEDTTVVHLASGEGFPDALSMGASTSGTGPLLLTRREALPEVTRAELERLSPCMVVVVGGASAVSDAVALEADSYTDPAACGF